jgi:hypothetical protein
MVNWKLMALTVIAGCIYKEEDERTRMGNHRGAKDASVWL